jgi:endonuclease/exonuclease/phosphatase family metal-dependent hydrolase
LRVPATVAERAAADGKLVVASYNVHRWTGVRGGARYAPERAARVIDEVEADVLALQEVLRPPGDEDPLLEIAETAGYHLAFVVTRRHRRGGELGNAILARWPIQGAHVIDLSYGRLEQRAALAATFRTECGPLTVASMHLALVDATRKRQVRALLGHPALADGPAVLLGDMNAWRTDPAVRDLARVFSAHHNRAWPATYPSVAPVLALDRAYVRGARLAHIRAHDSPAARRASDHLPVVATLHLDD